ncbi:hypothetical protein SISNIDRAFT_475558 [Sistotremastrum niveocremeum HHB9708]|uniref:DUF6570 domain-containing protein n=1 Tax=Sistotremastrum niveocremeum HHB9708 TaxID=1314777 RepID=A0A164QRM9_9AGAM|nr:hypothetical protein SISNIDRAFT_475558 [Sistotremastrum niveocremeum HHB9708]
MIARCRAKSWIIHLKEDDESSSSPVMQRGVRGNVIIFPQKPDALADILPPSVEDIITPICIVFVGSSKPTKEWLKAKAKPLVVRREKVRRALEWLKYHNMLYSHIRINHALLNTLEDEHMFDFHIEHRADTGSDLDVLVSRYDAQVPGPDNAAPTPSSELFEKVVITDVDGRASLNVMRAAALRHMKQKGGAFIQIPHEGTPSNEFFNPDLFPMLYPTLFPYGTGGFEDASRAATVSFDRQVRHYSPASSLAYKN